MFTDVHSKFLLEMKCKITPYSADNKEPISLELPDVWLWELIDEFIYQFQAFSQYKLRPKKTMEEVDVLQNKNFANRTWNVLSVLNVLHSLIDISNIKKQLEVSKF